VTLRLSWFSEPPGNRNVTPDVSRGAGERARARRIRVASPPLLTAALAALRVKPSEPELAMVHRWLDNWTGLGHIVTGMARQGFKMHLTNVDPGVWRATFSGSPAIGAHGFGTGPTPWSAVQLAAWEAIKDRPEPERADAEHIVLP
jgi:hypothetical protein